jgi:ribosomal-protein-alanine N-acetyltransferase
MEHEPMPAAKAAREVRIAVPADQQKIADLLFLESHVHRHLDWRAPLDWLGHPPYWVIEEGTRLSGALACPPDPESIAWIRLFVYASHLSGQEAWRMLWDGARSQLLKAGHATAAAIAVQRWLDPILLGEGFELAGQIVLLERGDQPKPNIHIPPAIHLRPMEKTDLPEVVDLDAAAFDPLWRNSLEALAKAYEMAAYASVAEDASGLIGYQLSTGSEFGTHLARLAVRPQAQRRGVGAALVGDLLTHVPEAMASRVTVNTQADNAASLALYYRLGFRRTGERYPVYRLEVD